MNHLLSRLASQKLVSAQLIPSIYMEQAAQVIQEVFQQPVYLAVIDDPNSSDPDFEYHLFDSRLKAIEVLMTMILKGCETLTDYTLNGTFYTDLATFKTDAFNALNEQGYVEANYLYYRLTALSIDA